MLWIFFEKGLFSRITLLSNYSELCTDAVTIGYSYEHSVVSGLRKWHFGFLIFLVCYFVAILITSFDDVEFWKKNCGRVVAHLLNTPRNYGQSWDVATGKLPVPMGHTKIWNYQVLPSSTTESGGVANTHADIFSNMLLRANNIIGHICIE